MHRGPAWIVVLNGVSCAGKTALAREIVERAVAPVVHLSFDHHHRSLAGRYATDRWPLYRRLVVGLARSAEAWWREGLNVVVDTLLERPRWMREILALLPPDRTFVIGLHAPLCVLFERAGAREDPENLRRRIRRQFLTVHRDVAYHLELESVRLSSREMAQQVLTLVGSPARSETAPEALEGLRPIEVADYRTFAQAVQAGGSPTWLHYFPFLHAAARTVRRMLRWEQVGDSVVVYHLIDLDRGPRLSLFLPPFPFDPAALEQARRRCGRFNLTTAMRILWVEEALLASLANMTATKHAADTELVYDRARVAALAGSRFDALRSRLDRLEQVPGLSLRSYTQEDRDGCEAMIDTWRGQPKSKRFNPDAYRLASSCLAQHQAFDSGLLRGEVAVQDREVRGFTFGGPIGGVAGSLFVVMDDGSVPGLGYLQRYSFLCNNPDIPLFRELADLDGPPGFEVKLAFDPVERPLWRVALRGD